MAEEEGEFKMEFNGEDLTGEEFGVYSNIYMGCLVTRTTSESQRQ